MKTKIELMEERAIAIEEMDSIVTLCETENRELNDDEVAKFDELETRANDLKAKADQSQKIENMRKELSSKNEKNESKEIRSKYSYLKAIGGLMNNNLDGVELEMHQEAQHEARSTGKSINGLGVPSMILENRANVLENGTAGIDVVDFAESLQGESILSKLGAQFLNGLTSDARIPIMSATSVAWEGETDATADGGSALSNLTLSPTRLATFVNLSKQLIAQHNVSVENAFVNDIARAVAAKIDEAVFTTTAGAPNFIGTGKTPIDKTDIVDLMLAMEEQVAGNKGLAGNLGYAISHKLMAEVKKGALVSSVSSIYNDGMLNGYPVYFTPFLGDPTTDDEGAFFGDWSQLVVCSWNGLDITIDPYSEAVNGMVKIVLNSYYDFGLKQGDAISLGAYSGTNS
jgi:HK97 family phage major capsid protein